MTDYISRQEEREAKIARYNTATSLNGGYISRQTAIHELQTWQKAMELRGRADDAETYGHGADILHSIPAADVVEVVRCKDCRNRGKTLCPIAFTVKELTEETDYCSFGERREQ